jgi:hypothetical protein
MNIREIISGEHREIIARRYRSQFTIMKPLLLEKEPGGTRTSLNNLRSILDAGYKPVNGIYTWNSNTANWALEVTFRRDGDVVDHTFYGFSVGYRGEGSRGMMEAGKLMGMNFDDEKVFGNALPSKGTIKMTGLK